MRAVEFIAENTDEPTRIKLGGGNQAAKAWIDKVYQLYPTRFQNNHVMLWGEGDDQQMASFELTPSFTKRGAVEVKWISAYPQRQGVGSKAMKELQRLAQEDGISLTLFPWDKGQVSQSKLTKFYKGQGFKPTVKGAKTMFWDPSVNEEINPDVLDPRFQDEQEIGDYRYTAALEPDRFHKADLFVIRCYDGDKMIGQAKFYTTFGDSLVSALTTVQPAYQKSGIASTMYAYARMLGNTIEPSASQLPPGKKMWKAWKKSGEAAHLMKEQELTELFDPATAFPLKWDKQFAGQGEFHAEAYDADGRIIGISFTPVGDGNATEVVFTRGGTHEMTGKGDAARVMATVINAINIFIQKYKPPYLVFSAKSTGGRASAYTAMIKRVARGYKLLSPEQYPEELGSYFEFMGSDQPFVLARV